MPNPAPASPNLASLSRFGFLTLPNYSMIACASAIEALRMANRISGEPTYDWRVVTLDGTPVQASNGLTLQPCESLGLEPFDAVFVCGGVDVRQSTTPTLALELRRLAKRGVMLGALCTGTFALAEAGLLGGYRCAIHWEDLSAAREEFRQIAFTDDMYAIDRDRLTCTGGVAPLDMMLTVIGARFGRALVRRISDQFIVDRDRAGTEPQPSPSRRPEVVGRPHLEKAVRLIEDNIEQPLTNVELSATVRLSPRQLERLFKKWLGETPAVFSAGLRLDRAQGLLRQTAMPVTDISVACGYTSPAHFSSAYRRRFGHPPTAERAAPNRAASA